MGKGIGELFTVIDKKDPLRLGSDAELFTNRTELESRLTQMIFELIHTPILIAVQVAELSSKGEKYSFRSNCLQSTA